MSSQSISIIKFMRELLHRIFKPNRDPPPGFRPLPPKQPPLLTPFEWILPQDSAQLEDLLKKIELPEPLEPLLYNVNNQIQLNDVLARAENWILKFTKNLQPLLNNETGKIWLQKHAEKLAVGQRGLTEFSLADAFLSVPPLKTVFDPIMHHLTQNAKCGIFETTGTGKSRLLLYLAHYWVKQFKSTAFYIDISQEIPPKTWENWFDWFENYKKESNISKPEIKETPLGPSLVIIEDLHTISAEIKPYVRRIINYASSKHYSVVVAYTKLPPKREDMSSGESWGDLVSFGTLNAPNFTDYWTKWQPYLFSWLKWIAPTLLNRKIPNKWLHNYTIPDIFSKNNSPYSFVVALGYIEDVFNRKILHGDFFSKLIYFLLHLFFLLDNERPILLKSFKALVINLFQIDSKRLTIKEKREKETNIDNLLKDWRSEKIRLLPPVKFANIDFQEELVQNVYHKLWAERVFNDLYYNKNDITFGKGLDKKFQKCWQNLPFTQPINDLLTITHSQKHRDLRFIEWCRDHVILSEKTLEIEILRLTKTKPAILPDSIGKIISLKELSLYKNILSEIPNTVGNLNQLLSLDLNMNKLTRLPDEICKLTKLKRLNLENNKLKKLPENFGDMLALEVLDLSNNELEELPESFGNLKSLKRLFIFNTSLTIRIYGFYGKEGLVCKNKLEKLPANFGKLENLIEFNGNQFLNAPSLTENERYALFDIVFQGGRAEIKNNHVISLDLSNIKTDFLPETLGDLPNLISLDLSWNKFEALPEVVGRVSSLELIDLSQNDELTSLPENLVNLHSLQKIYVDEEHLKLLNSNLKEFLKGKLEIKKHKGKRLKPINES